MATATYPAVPKGATGVLVLADGTVVFGRGFGAEGDAVGEVCFNTAITGYQEIMTDPSYAGQIITFTFPHIGNVGTNPEDVERDRTAALGCIVREDVTAPSNFRNVQPFDAPEGVFLSNGPGDPAATGEYAVPMIQGKLLAKRPAALRHLPWPSDAGAGAWGQDPQDESRPPRREPPGQGPDHRQGRDHR
jgi:carbamoylphosphate synthase small subunit